jgi:hypothetical protein
VGLYPDQEKYHLHPSALAFYVDPGSGSMILQLLLGGVSGVYVIFRLFKQKIFRIFGMRTESAVAASSNFTSQTPSENDDLRRSA